MNDKTHIGTNSQQAGNIILLLPQAPYRIMFSFMNIVLRITDTHDRFYERICIKYGPGGNSTRDFRPVFIPSCTVETFSYRFLYRIITRVFIVANRTEPGLVKRRLLEAVLGTWQHGVNM